MRITQNLLSQHLGRMFKKHWIVQGQRVILNTDAEKVLKEKGIPVYECDEIIKDIPELESKIVECVEEVPVLDERLNPLWHARPCYLYKNHSALLEGLDQAKCLTNSVEIDEGLPKKIESLLEKFNLDDNLVKRCIMMSQVFDATQEKLPKLHDPERPAWVFPRVYGIPDRRRNRMMCLNLLNLCQMINGKREIFDQRFFMESENISVPLEKDGSLLQLECRADLIVATTRPLVPHANADVVNGTSDIPLPDIYPLDSTVSLIKENIYHIQDSFPLMPHALDTSLHTVFFYYNDTEVANLFDLPVVEKQFLGRALVHTFAIAAAQARHKYGNQVAELKHPVTLQSIQTDGKRWHFSVFQLNTLDLNSNSRIKNILWHTPVCNLFEDCSYHKGKPELIGYNNDAVKRMLSFYVNG